MKRLYLTTIIIVFAVTSSLTVLPPAVGAESMLLSLESGFRCGNLVMNEGLEKLQVLANCGEPVASERSYIDRYGEVEKLVYGPDAGYYYVLYFYVGKLIQIESIRQL